MNAKVIAGVVGVVGYFFWKKFQKKDTVQPEEIVVPLTPEQQKKCDESVLNPRFSKLVQNAIPVPFCQSWHNGTGYFNHVLTDVNVQKLSNGLYHFTTDDDRKGLIIRQNHETHVLFQRYSDDKSYLACNSNLPLYSTECIEKLLYIAEAMWQEIAGSIEQTYFPK